MWKGAECLPPNTASNQADVGGPRQQLTPSLPSCPSVPSTHTSPEECEAISPRQALAPFPQMFAQTTAASRRPGSEISVNCFERGHKAFTVLRFHLQPPMVLRPGQVELCTANWRALGRARSLTEMLRPYLSPSRSLERSIIVNLG